MDPSILLFFLLSGDCEGAEMWEAAELWEGSVAEGMDAGKEGGAMGGGEGGAKGAKPWSPGVVAWLGDTGVMGFKVETSPGTEAEAAGAWGVVPK